MTVIDGRIGFGLKRVLGLCPVEIGIKAFGRMAQVKRRIYGATRHVSKRCVVLKHHEDVRWGPINMGESVITALISAGSGLLGVIVGSAVPWLKERLSEGKHARYLAIRVVCILDKFVEDCVYVADDDGLCEGRPNSDGYRVSQVTPPDAPSFPVDVDWRSIKPNLMYRALSLPREVEIANSYPFH